MTFADLGLRSELLEAVRESGYERPTQIQLEAIPPALAGQDVIGCAQTGTGKTAAFVLPMLHHLADSPERHGNVRGLILVPTRELAQQIERAAGTYGSRLSIEPMLVYGGMPIAAQIKDLKWGCDVLVATPGRLIDHLNRGTVNLSSVEVLVLDEADRMLDMGFIDDVRSIVRAIPKDRQTMLFSATMDNRVLSLIHEMMREPVQIQVGFQTSAEGITEAIHPVDYPNKYALLIHLLESWPEGGQVLVFTRMKSTAAYVCDFLKGRGIAADDLHGDKAQSDRTKSLERFRSKDIQVLVATNVAARGLDIVGVTHVVNFDVPDDPKDYVHRVGRTARGELTGDAVTLMSTHEILLVKDIERLMDKRVPRRVIEGFEPAFQDNAAIEAADGALAVDKADRSRLSRGRRSR
ncbi:MAG: DEAD/DEAH box helicase [Gemmatimonadales bacterium]|nr:MAG: DEAD/DEAH box helicase [Gemmatimonadales bacterium]